MYSSIEQLIRSASRSYQDSPALSLKIGFRTKTYSYRQVYDFSFRFISLLHKHGIKRGDRIVILSLNRPEYAIAIIGSFLAGVTVVPIDYRTNRETITKFVQATNPKAVFTTSLFLPLFEHLRLRKFLLEELTAHLAHDDPGSPVTTHEDELVAILFTSGTTGEPKGTMISYGNVLGSINSIRQLIILPNQLRLLSILPLSHALEMFAGLFTSYSYGCHIHYLERVNSITIIQALNRYRIQAMAVVPQMLRMIIQNIERHVKMEKKDTQWEQAHQIAPLLPKFFRRNLFREVHESLGGHFLFFACGSAPLDEKLAKLWTDMGIDVVEGYGASETTGFVSTNTLTRQKLGTVGQVLPGIQYKLSDSGELYVKGKNIVSGYFNNPEKTAESFFDGWFNTGDIVKIDSQGDVKIVGRDKFKIVLSDGKKVYPEDLEKKLNNHPLVVDSTVFGLDLGQGEVVHAEIICKEPKRINQIIDSVNQTLNPHEQIMDFGVWQLEDFPRTKTLKVDREAVRQEVLSRKSKSEAGIHDKQEEHDKLLSILSTISGRKHLNMHGNTTLATDLKLDSLKRIELLALIEEEIGVSVEELKITPKTTINDLRSLIEHGKPVVIDDGIKMPSWQFTKTIDNFRVRAQDWFVFPLFKTKIKLKVIHPENIQKIQTPQLLIFNHVGTHDVLNGILRTLPREIRQKTAIAATAQIWKESLVRGFIASFFGNCIPFVKAEVNGAMRGNFERVGQALDMGYNIVISPEGNITHTGELLPFHTGAGYIAVEMGVPVTPFKINGYFELWPENKKRRLNLYWPLKGGNIEVVVGEPIHFKKGTSYEEATQILREAIINLK